MSRAAAADPGAAQRRPRPPPPQPDPLTGALRHPLAAVAAAAGLVRPAASKLYTMVDDDGPAHSEQPSVVQQVVRAAAAAGGRGLGGGRGLQAAGEREREREVQQRERGQREGDQAGSAFHQVRPSWAWGCIWLCRSPCTGAGCRCLQGLALSGQVCS